MPFDDNTIVEIADIGSLVSCGIAGDGFMNNAGRSVGIYHAIQSSSFLHFFNTTVGNGSQQAEAGIRERWGYQATRPEVHCGG